MGVVPATHGSMTPACAGKAPGRARGRSPWPKKKVYRERNRIERFFDKLEQFRRIATRDDKLGAAFLAFSSSLPCEFPFDQLSPRPVAGMSLTQVLAMSRISSRTAAVTIAKELNNENRIYPA
jgi:hypothetical protein